MTRLPYLFITVGKYRLLCFCYKVTCIICSILLLCIYLLRSFILLLYSVFVNKVFIPKLLNTFSDCGTVNGRTKGPVNMASLSKVNWTALHHHESCSSAAYFLYLQFLISSGKLYIFYKLFKQNKRTNKCYS